MYRAPDPRPGASETVRPSPARALVRAIAIGVALVAGIAGAGYALLIAMWLILNPRI
jgi:hypothetical protein